MMTDAIARPVRLVGLVGSLRVGSFSRVLLAAAAELAPDGVEVVEFPLRDVPFYDGDLEAVGDPDRVSLLKRAVDEADGVLIITPEYNRSVPAVIKNAVDWLSRPHGDGPLAHASVGIVASTPGRHTAEGVREHLSAVVSTNTPHLHHPTLGLAGIAGLIEATTLTDPDTRRELRAWLDDFVTDVRGRADATPQAALCGGAQA